jgi:antitoxin (DNA-binding transcriptional repressor) of toxin-antitoxin stability system
MFHHDEMKNVAVRDLRQRWPEVEKKLEREGELLITRDGKAVARLVRFREEPKRRARFVAGDHSGWLRSVYGRRVLRVVDAALEADRADG